MGVDEDYPYITYQGVLCEKGAFMMALHKVRYPCKCSRVDPEHTVEDQRGGWKRYVCSSCGKVKFTRVVKDEEGK
jgi:hypothetical protein